MKKGPFERAVEDESKLRSLIFAAAFALQGQLSDYRKISDRNFDSSSTVRSNGPFFIYHSFSMYNGQTLTYKTVMLHPSFGFLLLKYYYTNNNLLYSISINLLGQGCVLQFLVSELSPTQSAPP